MSKETRCLWDYIYLKDYFYFYFCTELNRSTWNRSSSKFKRKKFPNLLKVSVKMQCSDQWTL